MKSNRYFWISLGVLASISALAYLPLVHKLGYMNDDWYLMYDGLVGGADFYHEVYSIDRPLRGFVMQIAFTLFGLNPLPYHLSAFVFRLMSGVGLLWVCAQLWPKRRMGNLLVAILFLLYPGFLSQFNPIDYQSQIISLASGMISVALTIKGIRSAKLMIRWVYIIISILTTWIYLGLVEYFIGFEVLRLTCIIIIFWRDADKKIITRLSLVLSSYAPFIIGAGGFLFWRLFLFSAERRATDVGAQLSSLFSSPLTALWWLNYLAQDIYKVIVTAWVIPFQTYAFSLRLRDVFWGLAIVVLGIVIIYLAFRWAASDNWEEVEVNNADIETREQLWMAASVIIFSLLPIIMVNRHVVFPDYSRYALAPSVGVAILLSVLLMRISIPSLRFVGVIFFVVVALQTHYGNSVRLVQETETMKNFWWQVAWRVPDFRTGTTVIADYPVSGIQEDYFVWGPANFIYSSTKQDAVPIEIRIPSAVLTKDVAVQILSGKGTESPLRRGNQLTREFRNVLVLSQPDPKSCVRFLDGQMPELSISDDENIMLISQSSVINNILVQGDNPTPPTMVFGTEPAHDWCFYYQKASLARQRGEWNAVVAIDKEVEKLGYHPNDQIELIPFLQAYAYLGDQKQVKGLSTRINTHVFYRLQACHALTMMPVNGYPLTPEMQSYVNELFCK